MTYPAISAITASFALVASALALPAHAQTQMRPGLWEHSMTIQDGNGQMAAALKGMQEQLAKMTPAQRQQMEQMMGSKGLNMNLGGGAGGATVLKMCMTQKQIDMSEMPQADKRCTQQPVQRSGNTMKIRFSCSGEPPTSGEGEVTVLSPISYTGKSVVTRVANGKSERMSIDQTGKWLSADCGDIKPFTAPQK